MKLKYVTELYSAKYPTLSLRFDRFMITLPSPRPDSIMSKLLWIGYAGYTKPIVITVPADLTVGTF